MVFDLVDGDRRRVLDFQLELPRCGVAGDNVVERVLLQAAAQWRTSGAGRQVTAVKIVVARAGHGDTIIDDLPIGGAQHQRHVLAVAKPGDVRR